MKYITVSPELKKACEDKMEATLEICRKKYNKDIPTPPLKFAQLGRRAGICRYTSIIWGGGKVTSEIVINPDFFKNHYDDMLNNTVPHEVAHYISAFVYGREGHGHGPAWKTVMRAIGLAGDRCHEYSLEGVKTRQVAKPFKYFCNCQGDKGIHMVTPHIHRRQQQSLAVGRKGYRCKRCSTYLRLDIPATKALPVAQFVQLFNVPKPEPITVTEPESMFRMVTKFVDGSLVNVKVPITA